MENFEEWKGYDFDNFFSATVADWSLCEIPDRDPDFVSYSGSAYWDLGNGVRRLSDHWGIVASCKWLMDGRRVRAFLCGECPYEEFRPMGRLRPMVEESTTALAHS